MALNPATIEAEIRQAALERFGCADAVVHRDNKPERPGVDDAGTWYGLFIRPRDGDEFQLVGRRRTRMELRGLVENRTCPKSSAVGFAAVASVASRMVNCVRQSP